MLVEHPMDDLDGEQGPCGWVAQNQLLEHAAPRGALQTSRERPRGMVLTGFVSCVSQCDLGNGNGWAFPVIILASRSVHCS